MRKSEMRGRQKLLTHLYCVLEGLREGEPQGLGMGNQWETGRESRAG